MFGCWACKLFGCGKCKDEEFYQNAIDNFLRVQEKSLNLYRLNDLKYHNIFWQLIHKLTPVIESECTTCPEKIKSIARDVTRPLIEEFGK